MIVIGCASPQKGAAWGAGWGAVARFQRYPADAILNILITIREITPDDGPAAAGLACELGYPATPAVLKERIEFLQRHPDHVVFVACDAGSVVGWVDVCIAHHLASDPRAEIGGLVVSAAVRSRGIGARLVAQAEQWAKEQGLTGMLVRSRSTREAAHRFYLREGYSVNKTSTVFIKELA